MNTKLLVMALAAAGAAAAVSASAFAGQAAPSRNTVSQTNATTAPADARAKAQRAVPAPGSRLCIQSTGSLIPPKQGQCLPVAGNSYSQQDIQRTGANNIGQALQMLDPSVTVHGH